MILNDQAKNDAFDIHADPGSMRDTYHIWT